MKGRLIDIKRYWDYYLVVLFLLVRLVMNIDSRPLMLFFAAAHIILLLMIYFKTKYFVRSFVIFLALDSMIGTYIASRPELGMMQGFGFEFYGTMLINFFFIWILIQNKSKKFSV